MKRGISFMDRDHYITAGMIPPAREDICGVGSCAECADREDCEDHQEHIMTEECYREILETFRKPQTKRITRGKFPFSWMLPS